MEFNRILQFVGLLSFICSAILGQAELIGEPWRHYVTVISVISAAIVAYYIQPYRNPDNKERVSDSKIKELNK